MISPDKVQDSYTEAHFADECGAGMSIFLGSAAAVAAEAVHLDSGPESTALGFAAGLLAVRGVTYAIKMLAYRRRAGQISIEDY